MDAGRLSDRFLAWLARAGWASSRFDDDGEFDDEGNLAIWHEDAQGRTTASYLLHIEDDRWCEVADGQTRAAVFAARDLEAVERRFWVFLAGAVRRRSGLPELPEPTLPGDGCRIEDGPSGSVLVDSSGTAVARGERRSLVALSRCLAATPDQLEAALLDPEGKPLFDLRG